MRKVALNKQAADFLESIRCHPAVIKQFIPVHTTARMNIQPVVIGPHAAEFNPVIIRCFQETFIKSALQKRPVIVIIPVKNKKVDAVISRCINFLRHYCGIGFIRVTPGRNKRLTMTGKARGGAFDQFPFTPPLPVQFLIAPIKMIVEFVQSDMADKASYLPYATRTTNRRVEYAADDMVTIYLAFRAMFALAR